MHMAGVGRQDKGADGTSSAGLVRLNVLKKVRRLIATGELRPGSRLTERELCETHHISRTAAREVIRQLDAEHLGEALPHQGLRIVRLTGKMVREIYELRADLEVRIIRAFIARATKRQINHLGVILKRLKKAIHVNDPEKIIEHSTEFISYMNDVADNQIVGEILAHLNARIELVRALAISWPGQADAGYAQLDLIRQKIATRDADNAEIEIRSYIQMMLNSATRQLDEDTE
ncbi:GntR family transcriptional regulator [Oceaniovalibus sp. ACAM 378]|nr:GntR family transcriptional regulator [Oceaniovalibus sp. ACAM 378]